MPLSLYLPIADISISPCPSQIELVICSSFSSAIRWSPSSLTDITLSKNLLLVVVYHENVLGVYFQYINNRA